ncbi:TPA: hypothetical protein DCZ32_00185, partial [Candidatus Uhrbacteria bacterium]|nr:hypothetical protein [Candidatus Uhrbacteria bacterium]
MFCIKYIVTKRRYAVSDVLGRHISLIIKNNFFKGVPDAVLPTAAVGTLGIDHGKLKELLLKLYNVQLWAIGPSDTPDIIADRINRT